MHVVCDTRAGRRTEIHPDIEPRRRINLAQRNLPALRQVHHLIRDLFSYRVEFARVQVRHDEHVAGDVGIKIQHHKRMRRAMHHEVVRIMFGIAGNAAKDTPFGLCIDS